MRRYLQTRALVLAVTSCVIASSVAPGTALALPSEPVAQLNEPSVSARQAQIAQVLEFLARPEARLQLRLAGLKLSQVERGLAALDDIELGQAADQAASIRAGAGGGSGFFLIFLVIAAVAVYLIAKEMHQRRQAGQTR